VSLSFFHFFFECLHEIGWMDGWMDDGWWIGSVMALFRLYYFYTFLLCIRCGKKLSPEGWGRADIALYTTFFFLFSLDLYLLQGFIPFLFFVSNFYSPPLSFFFLLLYGGVGFFSFCFPVVFFVLLELENWIWVGWGWMGWEVNLHGLELFLPFFSLFSSLLLFFFILLSTFSYLTFQILHFASCTPLLCSASVCSGVLSIWWRSIPSRNVFAFSFLSVSV